MSRPARVLVVGGGISGLAAAYRLTRLAPAAAVTIVESDRRLGGKILTERRDGFVIEGGPDSFLSSKPGALELCRELGLEDRLRGTRDETRRTFVLRRGRLLEIPEGLSGLVPTRLGPLLRSPLFSLPGKLRMGLELLLPPRRGGEDEALAAFITRRLGREAYERLIEPLMAGIYAGDGARLSLEATFPQLRDLERLHGGLLRGLLRRGPAAAMSDAGPAGTPSGGPRARGPQAAARPAPLPPFLTLAGGLEDLVWTLSSRLAEAEIRLGAGAEELQRSPGGYTLRLGGGETLTADAVILAAPAHVSAGLTERLDPELGAALRAIPHVSTATVTLAWPRGGVPHPLDGYGYIVPRAEGRPVLACTWTSSKFPHRAPEGQALIRVFIGRDAGSATAPVDSLGDEDLLRLARDEVRDILGIGAPPALARLFRWPQGMPQYTLGHTQRLAAMEARLARLPGLSMAGNFLRGVGLPDCIRSGEAAAARAAGHLESAQPARHATGRS